MFEPVIGLEVHAQLKTKSKVFCSCSTNFGDKPNTNICPVCTGMPGALPVLNKEAVTLAIKMGLATNCKINMVSRFARKNYFYPDLPKGYQITQYEIPVCENGYLRIRVKDKEGFKVKKIRIKRIHIEEDAGKNIHFKELGVSYVDFNRCGVPLIEIVSEPDISSPEEAVSYLKELRKLLVSLDVSEGTLEEGTFRCDANISLKKVGSSEFGTRTEMKNINSFNHVKHGLMFEIKRQEEILKKGGEVELATLMWDESEGKTRVMRTKEEAHDYRYFPEPDLLPLKIDEEWIEEVKSTIGELPFDRFLRFLKDYGLKEEEAEILSSDRNIASYFEDVAKKVKDPVLVANWMISELFGYLNKFKETITESRVSVSDFAKLLSNIASKKISTKMGKSFLKRMYENGEKIEDLLKKEGTQITDISAIEEVVLNVLKEHPDEVSRYKKGKTGLIGFFVGQVMKATRGKANPVLVQKVLREKLDS